MPSQSDISSEIMAALAVSEPDLDTSAGSVTRSIIDAVAGAISASSLDSHLLTYQYDIYSMSGADLDTFVQLFGLSRMPAQRSSGVLAFTRATATDVVSIPINTQVASADGAITCQTIAAIVMNPGDLSASVTAQAVAAGPAGNVAAGTFTQLQAPVAEITGVTNPQAFTGGTNQETDSQLQQRWIATVFRSMAGTSSMFLGIALNNPDCYAANVVGPQTRYTEQLQVSGGSATSTVSDAQYVYPAGQIAGKNIAGGDVAAPGVQYSWNYNVIPPVVQVIDQSYFTPGLVFELSYIYLDQWSRNQPASGIFNRVDVWCAGSDPEPAAQTFAFSPAITFSGSATSSYYVNSFVRPDGTIPTPNNIFVPLAWGPVLTVPGTITIGAVTYGQATPANPLGTTAGSISYAYQIVHRTGAFGWGAYSDFGLEWVASMAPPTNSVVAISEGYTFNQMISDIQADLEQWRLVGTDVQAHQAIQMALQFSLAVVYDPAITVATTQTAINNALQNFLATLGFQVAIYPASVIAAVEAVPGVIACRFLVGRDYPTWNPATPNAFNVGIQQVVGTTVVASFVSSSGEPFPVITNDATVCTFGQSVLVTRALNTLGAFG